MGRCLRDYRGSSRRVFLHRSRERSAAFFSAANFLLRPSSSFSNSPKRSTSSPKRCNNMITFAFIYRFSFFDVLFKNAETPLQRFEGESTRPSRKKYTTLFYFVKGVVTAFFVFLKYAVENKRKAQEDLTSLYICGIIKNEIL